MKETFAAGIALAWLAASSSVCAGTTAAAAGTTGATGDISRGIAGKTDATGLTTREIAGARADLDAGRFEEAASRFASILAKSPDDSRAVVGWCRAMRRLGRIAGIPTRFPAQDGASGATRGTALGLGLGRLYAGKVEEAEESFLGAAAGFRAMGDPAGEAEALMFLGSMAVQRSDAESALSRLDPALDLRRRAGDPVATADTLLTLGGARKVGEDLTGAESAYAEAWRLYEAAGLRSSLALVQVAQGDLRRSRNDLEGAEKAFASAIATQEASGDRVGLAVALVKLAAVLERRSEWASAVRTATRAIAMAEAIEDTAREAQARIIRANCRVSLGKLGDAGSDFERARGLFEALGQKAGLADCLTGLGNIALMARDLDGALELYRRNLALRIELEDVSREAQARANLGGALEETGQWAEAMEAYETALRLYQDEVDDPGRTAWAMAKVARVEMLLGRVARARSRLETARGLAREAGDGDMEALTMEQLAHLAQRSGDLTTALSLFDDAARRRAALGDLSGEASALLNAGEMLRLSGRRDEAEKRYGGARERAERSSDRQLVALAASNLALVALEGGRPAEAFSRSREALSLVEAARDEVTRVETLVVRGRALEALGDPVAARASLEQAVRLENRALDLAGGADLATALQGRAELAPVPALARLLASRGRASPSGASARGAFEALQSGRARVLRRRMNASSRRRLQSDPQLGAPWLAAQRTIAETRTRLHATGIVEAEKKRLSARLEQAETVAGSLLRRWDRRITRGSAGEQVTVETVQRALGGRDALIAFLVSEPRSYAWVVTRSRFRQIDLPSASRLEADVKAAAKCLDPRTSSSPCAVGVLAALGRSVFGDALAGIPSEARLWLVPDGEIARAPLDAALVGNPAWARADDSPAPAAAAPAGEDPAPVPLGARYATVILPSAATLVEMGAPRESSPRIAIFGDPVLPEAAASLETPDSPKVKDGGWSLVDAETALPATRGFYEEQGFVFRPLPGASREIESLGSVYAGRGVEVHAGTSDTEDAFKDSPLERFGVIHFATHAFSDRAILDRSAVVFSLDEDPREDGFLTLQEILGLRLGPSIVVLAACETAGEETAGVEGLLGLARAFLAAGARAVVATIRPVDDRATSIFMTHFHKALRDGATASAAALAVRRAMIDDTDPRVSDPRAWSPFVVIGDGRARLSAGSKATKAENPGFRGLESGPKGRAVPPLADLWRVRATGLSCTARAETLQTVPAIPMQRGIQKSIVPSGERAPGKPDRRKSPC